MIILGEKDQTKIKEDVKNLIRQQLSDNFKDQRGRPVVKIDSVTINNIDIDEKQTDRDTIVISKIHAYAYVWVSFSGGQGNSTFELRNNVPIRFEYKEEVKAF